MKHLALAILFFGIAASLVFTMTHEGDSVFRDKSEIAEVSGLTAEGDQYFRYRNLAIRAGLASGLSDGIMSSSTVGMTPTIEVNNRISNGILYVWADLGSAVHNEVLMRLKGSLAFGYNRSGVFTTAKGATSTTLPAFVPVDNSVSIINLN